MRCPSLSSSAILADHPLPTRARMLFISGSGAGSTRGFHERDSRANLFGSSSVSIAKSREVLEDGPGASASANTGLSSRAIHLHARGDYLGNEKHSSCCWEVSCSSIDTSRLCVPGAYYFGIYRGRRSKNNQIIKKSAFWQWIRENWVNRVVFVGKNDRGKTNYRNYRKIDEAATFLLSRDKIPRMIVQPPDRTTTIAIASRSESVGIIPRSPLIDFPLSFIAESRPRADDDSGWKQTLARTMSRRRESRMEHLYARNLYREVVCARDRSSRTKQSRHERRIPARGDARIERDRRSILAGGSSSVRISSPERGRGGWANSHALAISSPPLSAANREHTSNNRAERAICTDCIPILPFLSAFGV